MKTLIVAFSDKEKTVELEGISDSARLFPRMARQAAAIAFDQKYPVRVIDVRARVEYRLYSAGTHRRYLLKEIEK